MWVIVLQNCGLLGPLACTVTIRISMDSCWKSVDPLWQGSCQYIWLFHVLKYNALVVGSAFKKLASCWEVVSLCQYWKWERKRCRYRTVSCFLAFLPFHFLPVPPFPLCLFTVTGIPSPRSSWESMGTLCPPPQAGLGKAWLTVYGAFRAENHTPQLGWL